MTKGDTGNTALRDASSIVCSAQAAHLRQKLGIAPSCICLDVQRVD